MTSVGAAATANVTPGGYSIIASMGNLQTHLGYGLAFSNTGVLTVSPRAVTVTALGGASTYGDSPTNPGLAASGLVNGDTVAALTGLASSFNINAQTHAGTIALSVIGANTDADYAVTTLGGSWTVSPRAVTVTALGGTSTYGDSPTNPGLAASGLVNGDTVAALSGLANSFGVTASTAPGPLGVAVRGALANSNYTLIGTVSGTWTINPEALTIAADNQSRPQAVANPDLTYRITQGALLNGDQLSGGLATLANVQSPPGVYDITQGDLAGQNYRITFIPGAVTVLGSAAPGTTLSSALTTTPGWDQYKISTRVVISSDTFAAPQQTAISVEGLDQVLVIVDPRYATPSVCLEGWSCVAISPASHASRQTSDAGRIRTDGPAPAQPAT